MAETPNDKRSDPKHEQAAVTDSDVQRVHAQLMREKEEPREGFPPMPIFLLFLFAGIVFICGIYMGKKSAGFRWDVYDPYFDPAALNQPKEKPKFDPIARGERVFSQQCAQCHQATGQGVPGAFPPLAGASWVVDTRVVPTAILLNGLAGEIEVAGNTYNGVMPAFGGILSDRDIGAVLTYIRQAWGNNAGPISEEQVAEARAAHGGRSSPWSAAELLELSELSTSLPEAEPASGDAGGDAGVEASGEAEPPSA